LEKPEDFRRDINHRQLAALVRQGIAGGDQQANAAGIDDVGGRQVDRYPLGPTLDFLFENLL
jgi:hypothetical protein